MVSLGDKSDRPDMVRDARRGLGWRELPARVGLEQAQRFYDHVATNPGEAPDGVSVTILKGSAGKPQEEWFSATRHWRVPGHAARLDYQFNSTYQGGGTAIHTL